MQTAGQSVVCQHDTAVVVMCVHVSHNTHVRDLPRGLVKNMLQVLCLTCWDSNAGAERGEMKRRGERTEGRTY